jgi:phospholipase/carboxylesterase
MFNRVHGPGSFPNGISRPEASGDLPLELRELLEVQGAGSPVSDGPANSDWPVSIYIPERYEENYAYPLVVWFHEDGHHEGQIESVMGAVSRQNYIGLGIQGNQPLADGSSFGWNSELLDYGTVSLHDLLSVTIRRLRQAYHIHSERIFLAGAGVGADVALQQLTQMPQWYAGAVLFSPACERAVVHSLMASTLRDKSLLWTVSRTASSEELAQNVEAVQLARLAGGEPEVRVTDTVMDPESSDVRFVDHWLLSKIDSQAFV